MELTKIESKRLDHHGIVAGIIDDLGIAALIDQHIGNYGGEKVSVGQAVKAMIINGLGFSNRTLTLSPQFSQQLPMDRLFGSGVSAEDFNRHKLARALDALSKAGVSEVFSDIASQVALKEEIDRSKQSLDTTSFSFSGEYEFEEDGNTIHVTHGYSKDHRPDLKQIVAELIVTHDSGIPLALQCHDGNASDSKIFRDRCCVLVDQFRSDQLLVADSKLYSKKNSEYLSKINFVTRIPETSVAAKQFIESGLNKLDQWDKVHNGALQYIAEEKINYDIQQKWILAFSEEGVGRSKKTLLKAIEKERKSLTSQLFHLQAQRYACEKDAQKEFDKISKKAKYLSLAEPEIILHPKYEKRGRPKNAVMQSSSLVQVTSKICDTMNIEYEAKRRA